MSVDVSEKKRLWRQKKNPQGAGSSYFCKDYKWKHKSMYLFLHIWSLWVCTVYSSWLKSRLSLIKPQSVWDLFALDSQHLSATTTGPGVNIPQMYSLCPPTPLWEQLSNWCEQGKSFSLQTIILHLSSFLSAVQEASCPANLLDSPAFTGNTATGLGGCLDLEVFNGIFKMSCLFLLRQTSLSYHSLKTFICQLTCL